MRREGEGKGWEARGGWEEGGRGRGKALLERSMWFGNKCYGNSGLEIRISRIYNIIMLYGIYNMEIIR